jgi:hypothetical protein
MTPHPSPTEQIKKEAFEKMWDEAINENGSDYVWSWITTNYDQSGKMEDICVSRKTYEGAIDLAQKEEREKTVDQIIEHIEGMRRIPIENHEHSCYKYADHDYDNKRWACSRDQCDYSVCVFNRPFDEIITYLKSLK